MSLITEAIKGNVNSMCALIEEHQLMLYKTAYAILHNEDDAKDAVQETLVSMFRNISKVKEAKNFKTWITRILINKCYDIIYKNNINTNKNKNQKLEFEYEKTEEMENAIISKLTIEKALKLLDTELKEITVLFYYDDFSVKEISKILEIPVGTVKSRLSRAREKIYSNVIQKRGENIEK